MQVAIRNRRQLVAVAVVAVVAALLPLLTSGPAQAQVVVTIPEIQGAQHTSPLEGMNVTTTGVVTAVAFNGYYLQDPIGDGDPDTSDGIFVFRFGAGVAIGDEVQVTDFVSEFVGGGCGSGNLSTTQLSPSSSNQLVLSSGNPLPAPLIIGTGGRIPPNVITYTGAGGTNDQPSFCPGGGNLSVYNPSGPNADGLDFYESLEGMLVTIDDPVAVSATRPFSSFSSEMFTLPNNGTHAAPPNVRTARPFSAVSPGDR